MFGEGCVLKKGVLCKASNGMDFTRCPTRPRYARDDVLTTQSLRGVFDVAIHLHAFTQQRHGLPRYARNDVPHTPSLRGVFDVAIHLHALTIAAKAAKAWIATLRSQ
jgi:hypothetical protein